MESQSIKPSGRRPPEEKAKPAPSYSQIETGTVAFDVPKARRLKVAYEQALDENKAVFVFGGREYVVGFAYYLLEYLAPKLGDEKIKSARRPPARRK